MSANPNIRFRTSHDNPVMHIDKIINQRGQSLLLEACEAGNIPSSPFFTAVAKILLEKHSDPNIVDWKGMNALSYALKKNNTELARVLIYQSRIPIDLEQFVEVALI